VYAAVVRSCTPSLDRSPAHLLRRARLERLPQVRDHEVRVPHEADALDQAALEQWVLRLLGGGGEPPERLLVRDRLDPIERLTAEVRGKLGGLDAYAVG
jgi:hypothetical protein